MASPIADTLVRPSSISPPPPVYLRASPPPEPPAYDPPAVPNINKSEQSAAPETRKKAVPVSALTFNHEAQIQRSPQSPVRIDNSVFEHQAYSAVVEGSNDTLDLQLSHMNISGTVDPATSSASRAALPPRVDSMPRQVVADRHTSASTGSWSLVGSNEKDEGSKQPSTDRQGEMSKPYNNSNSSEASLSSSQQMDYQPLQYHHRPLRDSPPGRQSGSSSTEYLPQNQLLSPRQGAFGTPRPLSVYSSTSDLRARSPHGRNVSGHSPDSRPKSTYVEMLNTPYPQQVPSPSAKDNEHLRMLLGNNVSLLSHKQTFEMYLANVKKTNDPAVQYEFAVFMISAIQEMYPDEDSVTQVPLDKQKDGAPDVTKSRLLLEAKAILQRLADRSYPFAQYYLGDGFSSGLFSKGKQDYDRALPLFVAASKHGHAEASYRAGLCNEFGWGCRTDGPKAANFYRTAATKNHPGAMLRLARACLAGDLGLGKREREGLKWLKRAADAADMQYNAAPYELGLLHETGYGQDIFKDESYAAQLFTKSADLGNRDANFRMGEAYEHGQLGCPHDPALSIHFYTAAAQLDHPQAQMALCAWYLLGAEPILERDEMEAYEWARRAAEQGLAKAQYTVGFFTESGIGCRRDPLEANVWYVKAADQGEERAKHRLAAIQAASEGANPMLAAKSKKKGDRRPSDGKKDKKFLGIF
ncbi:chitin synthase activator (Chs3), putative [Talaromyces stipitatus ATCC 10500]|uniref:Chitin synthase activator (Chs3), putative n=1 Tax=Talaromyces stipitatus (strain ATCC 10500 / CBS 375.48 / QM 6759 / NRRL 1006) TaxID=441959 RepID=B8MQF8_TALSN|nr:chitin synthase activator (Chs3), putative [Talaromyces stipitatus ATCC 10500]EED13360.1 chitin synthase activator (Chs3), putative [Talaromyces stipitatus ATCC 10500]